MSSNLATQRLVLLRSRKVSVTVFLVALGALSGAVITSGIFIAAVTSRVGLIWSEVVMAAKVGSLIGAPIGALIAPVLGLNRFRRVQIGRALIGVTLWPLSAAALGAVIDARWSAPFGIVGLLLGLSWASRRR